MGIIVTGGSRGIGAAKADIVQLFESAERAFSPITGLVNNAGVTGGFARVESVRADAFSRYYSMRHLSLKTPFPPNNLLRATIRREAGATGAIRMTRERTHGVTKRNPAMHQAAS